MKNTAGRNRARLPSSSRNWNREDLAWCAGLFEGEGTIGMHGDRTGTRFKLAVVSSDRDVLEKFLHIIGHGRIYPQATSTLGHKPLFVWIAAGRFNVYAVGIALWPWLGTRRREKFKSLVDHSCKRRGVESSPIPRHQETLL